MQMLNQLEDAYGFSSMPKLDPTQSERAGARTTSNKLLNCEGQHALKFNPKFGRSGKPKVPLFDLDLSAFDEETLGDPSQLPHLKPTAANLTQKAAKFSIFGVLQTNDISKSSMRQTSQATTTQLSGPSTLEGSKLTNKLSTSKHKLSVSDTTGPDG